MTEEYQELGFEREEISMHATDQTFQILLSQLLEKVEDRCPECGSEQYVWQQK